MIQVYIYIVDTSTRIPTYYIHNYIIYIIGSKLPLYNIRYVIYLENVRHNKSNLLKNVDTAFY